MRFLVMLPKLSVIWGRLGTLRYLKLLIQEPEAYGINRLAVVELNAAGANEVRVQGVQESWLWGKQSPWPRYYVSTKKRFLLHSAPSA